MKNVFLEYHLNFLSIPANFLPYFHGLNLCERCGLLLARSNVFSERIFYKDFFVCPFAENYVIG